MAMTTTNGGTQGRIVEHIEGVVQSPNDRGVRLIGEDDWRNWSRWADKPAELPRRGARLRLGLDASGFVRQLKVLDHVATFAAGKAQVTENVSSADVPKIAEHWLRWVEQEEG